MPKESSNVDEQASLSPLSEFTNTPAYSPVSDIEERDAGSFAVEVDCEVQTSGNGKKEMIVSTIGSWSCLFW